MFGTVSDVDLRLLRVFSTVVRCGGFAAAQSALNVSQAQISMQMKRLEERLGMRLCYRGRGGFWLTGEGRDVYDACQTLFRSLDGFNNRWLLAIANAHMPPGVAAIEIWVLAGGRSPVRIDRDRVVARAKWSAAS